MAASTALMQTPLRNHPEVELVATGKVREIYKILDDPNSLLFVTTDRVSAFDVVLDNAIAEKGAVLTMLSAFWFELFKKELPNVKSHFVSIGLPASLKSKLSKEDAAALEYRSMVVRRLEVLPIESIIRGYITGQRHFLVTSLLSLLTLYRLCMVFIPEERYRQWRSRSGRPSRIRQVPSGPVDPEHQGACWGA